MPDTTIPNQRIIEAAIIKEFGSYEAVKDNPGAVTRLLQYLLDIKSK